MIWEKCHGRETVVLVAAPRGASSAMLFRTASGKAADKMTRAQAEYQDTPNGIYSCGLFSLFEAPNGCKVVEGEISRDGWCKHLRCRIEFCLSNCPDALQRIVYVD